ncbi:hypothetical protein Hamer_G021733 [Homarus americanus]|uniref:Uncharacterized protein n=1 Tax=Homarus americanus TaxID=6706 RepID=A0A8J5JZK9_HOMAM|nr:hypothetical protein Hamer_G021733 [Homarus americanus]
MRGVWMVQYLAVVARMVFRKLLKYESWLTLWLCVVFLADLAILRSSHHTHLRPHYGGYNRSMPFPIPRPHVHHVSATCRSKCFRARLAVPLRWNTFLLVAYIRGLIHHPAHHSDAHTPEHHAHNSTEDQAYKSLEDGIVKLVGHRKGGVYVVVGAGGRHWGRLARLLEGDGWRGLMVEANVYSLAQQEAAEVPAAFLHACVTSKPLPHTEWMWRTTGGDLPGLTAEEEELGEVHKVVCLPLESVVLTLGVFTVDVLVVDSPGLADDLLYSLVRRNFKVKMMVLRVQRRFDGQDETRYKEMVEDVGLHLLMWHGNYLILTSKHVPLVIKTVTS